MTDKLKYIINKNSHSEVLTQDKYLNFGEHYKNKSKPTKVPEIREV